MKPRSILQAALSILLSSIGVTGAAQPKNSVLLRNIKSLTLYKDRKTTARRVSAIPQLKCTGGSGKGHYEIDVLRCTNSGSSYDEDNIDWTCKASLPAEFKLGETEVICEGYSNPDDPYILKGSCGVEYRLILTELGEEKYGSSGWFGKKPKVAHQKSYGVDDESKSEQFFNFAFWCLFIGVGLFIAYKFIASLFSAQPAGGGGGPRARGGGGGGGWGGSDDGNDPPPPYDPSPPRTYSKSRTSKPRTSTSQQASSESWRPGFWTGAAVGAAGAHVANAMNRNRAEQQARQQESSWFNRGSQNPYQDTQGWFNGGEGSSRSGPSSSSSEPGSSRYESTGFGSTRRR